MKTRYILCLVLSTLGCAPVSADTGFYVGIEGGQSRTEADAPSTQFIGVPGVLVDSQRDRQDTALGLYLGYELNEHVALELGYADLGEITYTESRDIDLGFPFPTITPGLNAPPPAFIPGGVAVIAVAIPERRETRIDSQSITASVLGRYAFAGSFAVIGRAGIVAQRLESDLRVWLRGDPVRVIGGNRDGTSAAAVLGLGAEWAFHPKWHVRLQAQRQFRLEKEQIDLVELGDVTLFTCGVGYRF